MTGYFGSGTRSPSGSKPQGCSSSSSTAAWSIAPDLRIVTSPGHTSGHQSVVATTAAGTELFIGDAAYTRRIWDSSGTGTLPDGQAADIDAWRGTLGTLKALTPERVHFCHDG